MITKELYTKSGYVITVQILSDTINHFIIRDTNLYPDSDSRSTENREMLVPINDIKDIKRIKKLFKNV